MTGWQLWIDRGGTFTDILAISPNDELHSLKVLSDNAQHSDALIEGVQQLLSNDSTQPSSTIINDFRMGTTIATNALLERKGAPTLLVVTEGFTDLLTIRTQHRQELFNQHIIKPAPLYQNVCTVRQRHDAAGKEIIPLDENDAEQKLRQAFQQGIRSVAIACVHSNKNPTHELTLGAIAEAIGFTTVVLSHAISASSKFLLRAETAVAQAYLQPIMDRYMASIKQRVSAKHLLMMKSNGDLTPIESFRGIDAILSGPAGGIVGMTRTAQQEGFHKIIGFDMGGTSTDVSLFAGEFEIEHEHDVNGIPLNIPMLPIHTVAAGGGSVCWHDGQRLRIGPDSTGAHPGPACYGKKGQCSVTDIQVIMGRIQADLFPAVFGDDQQSPIDSHASKQAFEHLFESLPDVEKQRYGQNEFPLETLAQDYLDIAVDNMAKAIKTISTQRGIELHDFVLNAFGGAAGQHACAVADALGIHSLFIHAQTSLLSAFGMGCASLSKEKTWPINQPLRQKVLDTLSDGFEEIITEHEQSLENYTHKNTEFHHQWIIELNYQHSEKTLRMICHSIAEWKALTHDHLSQQFHQQHKQQFGFHQRNSEILITSVSLRSTLENALYSTKAEVQSDAKPYSRKVWFHQSFIDTPFIPIRSINVEANVLGPAVLFDENSTLVIEPGWQAHKTRNGHWIIRRIKHARPTARNKTQLTAARLEIFNNLFMFIAEQMGAVLQQTAKSINIKERLDFSCALFDINGNLIANAPHMPVHLGSMSESVKYIIANNSNVKDEQAFLLNSPYHGGTHLPDLTVVSPVFVDDQCRYWVASRGHHADIGGKTPGSMPASSKTIEEEGVVFDNFLLMEQGQLCESELLHVMKDSSFPCRNPQQVVADLQAQIAANQRGINELHKAINQFGENTIDAYMNYVQDNAEHAIKKIIPSLTPGTFQYPMDNGAVIKLTIKKPDDQTLIFDFNGTSEQQPHNFNAPLSVTRAAVMYVLRSLVEENIPLNEGCLRPITIRVPESTILNPTYPHAVVAGNVETSQAITDTLFGALGRQAGAQGTMNNLTFGDDEKQYYETIGGGSGAGESFHGADAVQTHMTNSRMTDIEIIESHYPVRIDQFEVRKHTGGKGAFNGGNGVIRKITFLSPMHLSILSNNRKHHPFGMAGGEPGLPGKNQRIKANGEVVELPATVECTINEGDQIIIQTPGGGGFGKPLTTG